MITIMDAPQESESLISQNMQRVSAEIYLDLKILLLMVYFNDVSVLIVFQRCSQVFF